MPKCKHTSLIINIYAWFRNIFLCEFFRIRKKILFSPFNKHNTEEECDADCKHKPSMRKIQYIVIRNFPTCMHAWWCYCDILPLCEMRPSNIGHLTNFNNPIKMIYVSQCYCFESSGWHQTFISCGFSFYQLFQQSRNMCTAIDTIYHDT